MLDQIFTPEEKKYSTKKMIALSVAWFAATGMLVFAALYPPFPFGGYEETSIYSIVEGYVRLLFILLAALLCCYNPCVNLTVVWIFLSKHDRKKSLV